MIKIDENRPINMFRVILIAEPATNHKEKNEKKLHNHLRGIHRSATEDKDICARFPGSQRKQSFLWKILFSSFMQLLMMSRLVNGHWAWTKKNLPDISMQTGLQAWWWIAFLLKDKKNPSFYSWPVGGWGRECLKRRLFPNCSERAPPGGAFFRKMGQRLKFLTGHQFPITTNCVAQSRWE